MVRATGTGENHRKISQLFFLRSHSLVDLAGWGGDLLTVTGEAANSSKHSTPYDAAMEVIGHKDESEACLALMIY
ncbi:hypothetical protein JOC94_001520 [Bacillus thermophilus]|uniref:Uncharacterized protein n=1 Tax=Siminovitchia thermophila TaxID=1245522 RepID=A0ABS2R4K7_9BACI|nr:hypothetical protein [Siminovitchia thermophila]MBM7714548.1 hypothetical protein [Siminovitchia thermophila]ONK22606.1 hypothetical protein BLX87_14575 [Bacillus sp. VT-16-64]